MKTNTFEPIDLGHGYTLDADERQWILRRVQTNKEGVPLRMTNGDVRNIPNYYPTLPALLRAMAERRLRTTLVDDWGRVVEDMDTIQRKLTKVLSKAWVSE